MAFTGSCAIILRFSNLKTVVRSGSNVSAITSNVTHRLANTRLYATEHNDQATKKDTEKLEKPMSKAMKAYLERAKQHDEFMVNQTQDYQIGKRHLANIMGEDPDEFTQRDIDAAIEYLFPSGLYDRKAKPMFKPPEEIFPKRKAAEFDSSGRPYHSMFYTCKPNYYQTLYDLVEKFNSLNEFEDRMIQKGLSPDPENAIDLTGSLWMPKAEIEKLILEVLNDHEYAYLVTSLERLVDHPYSYTIKPEIMQYRKTLMSQTAGLIIPPLQYDANGRPFIYIVQENQQEAKSLSSAMAQVK
ncbi:28S ribosomal protein S9, mitochondrial [Cephus cinctus]|uniref:28S ribosomal protein S9, mitochondrial n=1 Tax=Cephus cinctus TaxID=211228 RepID=A0AAJ7R9G2_CEPCN|nr:28S ribosomal protein S9, mitochondrial [Cephus cinctus]